MIKSVKFLLALLFQGFCLYATAQTTEPTFKTDSIADKMLTYQLSNGAWSKQLIDKSVVNYKKPITPALMETIKATDEMHATIDNSATTREINALVKAFKTTGNKSYLQAAEKGIDYLLKAQYKNGGWPQYYPDKSSYRAEITYNDNAIINVLNIMLDIVRQSNGFDVVNINYIAKADNAVKRGLDCILKTQIVQGDKLSIWAAQYDQNTLKPAKARNFEPASLSTSESVNIVKFLMRIDQPSLPVKQAIKNAVQWFDNAKIKGFKFEKMANGDKGLIADVNAVIWARFHDINTNKPIFGDRDNSIKDNVADISFERRNNYAWYGDWAVGLIQKDYPKWLKILGE